MREGKGSGITGKDNCIRDGAVAGFAIPVKVGIVGGFFAAWIPLFIGMSVFREVPPLLNHFIFQFENIPQIQVFLLFIGGSVLLGYITGNMTTNSIKNFSGVVSAGIISGFFSAIVVIAGLLWFSNSTRVDMSISQPVELYIPMVFSIILFSIVFQVLGAVCGYFWHTYRQYEPPQQDAAASWVRIILKPTIATIVVMVLIIGIPVGLSHAMPKDDWQTCAGNPDRVKVERLSEDTIRIIQLTELSPSECSSYIPDLIKIYIDDKDVSTQLIIQMTGLPDEIDPPEGLVYAKGAQVIVKGPDFSNKTHNPILRIEKCGLSANGSLVMYQMMYGHKI